MRNATLLLLSLAACNTPPSSPAPTASAPALACTLVVLKTGARTEPLAGDEGRAVFAGHFANMQRLAREGHLLLAGPYGKEKTDPNLRGLFVLGTGDRAAAERLASTDPGVAAGVFALEYHDLVTAAALRDVLAAELAAEDAAIAAGRKRAPGEGGRLYVLLQADAGEQAIAALGGHPATLLLGRLDGTRAFAVLDAADPAAAKALLAPLAARIGPHTLDSWFATGLLASLRDPAARGTILP